MVKPTIGTLNEGPLHASLKAWYAQSDDRLEISVDGYVIDIVRGDLLLEIQTQNFSSIKSKVTQLVHTHPLRLIYPIAYEKWIVKLAEDGISEGKRRKSPKRGVLHEVFAELVSFPHLLANPNFSLEILMIQEEQVRRRDRRRGWRRGGWVIHERRLIQVIKRHTYTVPADMMTLLPETLPDPFTTNDLATALDKSTRLARQMAYCLRKMGCITPIGKRKRAILYRRQEA